MAWWISLAVQPPTCVPCAAVLPDHMPSSHRRYTDWTIGRLLQAPVLVGNSYHQFPKLNLR
jgi:hypothetical protein